MEIANQKILCLSQAGISSLLVLGLVKLSRLKLKRDVPVLTSFVFAVAVPHPEQKLLP